MCPEHVDGGGVAIGDLLWVLVTGAGAAMAAAIGKLWSHTVDQRNQMAAKDARILELMMQLQAEHKDDLRRMAAIQVAPPRELVDIPWAPSKRPPAPRGGPSTQ